MSPFPSLAEYLRGLPLDAKERLEHVTANHLLQLVYMAFEATEEGIPWEFVLNTVDNVRTENDTVWIGGECSPFVRTRQ